MIAHVQGRLARKEPHQAVIDVGGVGYRVFIPLSTFYRLPEVDEPVFLHTFTQVREDAIHLYGFATEAEKSLFQLLTGVSGIGPRLATNILSGISATELGPALSDGDLPRLQAIPGVGRKTAERLVVELRDKVRDLLAPSPAGPPARRAADPVFDQVVSALVNLGCHRKEAVKAAERAREILGPDADFEKVIKEALKQLARGR